MKPSIFRFKPLLLSLLLCAGAAMASEPVDINSADAAQLDKVLIGVGAAKAEAIIEYRKANGPFKSADELANVKGIGLKTVERNRDLIKVGGARAPAASACRSSIRCRWTPSGQTSTLPTRRGPLP